MIYYLTNILRLTFCHIAYSEGAKEEYDTVAALGYYMAPESCLPTVYEETTSMLHSEGGLWEVFLLKCPASPISSSYQQYECCLFYVHNYLFKKRIWGNVGICMQQDQKQNCRKVEAKG